ncbi:hypothetical protein C3495_11215 [Clostridiaceae bacterium 14S0207]|nr:hypothetical protein C3495_11215 [Clostridiaceae bacterium 14S0207]
MDYTMTFKEYLETQDIRVMDNIDIKIKVKNKNLCEKDVFKHIEALADFHYKTMGFQDYLKGRLDNKIGRKVEEYKVSLKRLKRDLNNINKHEDLNSFEKRLMIEAPEYIGRANNIIRIIDNQFYINFIIRSMERKEVCLSNVWLNNIICDNKNIYVKDISDACYNLVEMDCVELIKKLRKKGYKDSCINVCKYFCSTENLGYENERFILAMASFPEEFMKICNKYRNKKKNWGIDKYMNRLDKAILEDGESLI